MWVNLYYVMCFSGDLCVYTCMCICMIVNVYVRVYMNMCIYMIVYACMYFIFTRISGNIYQSKVYKTYITKTI